MAKAKKGDVLSCGVCGLVVVVDEACGCAAAEILCCKKPMAKGKPAAAKKKPVAKAVAAPAKTSTKAAAKAKPAAKKAGAKAKPAAKKPARAKK